MHLKDFGFNPEFKFYFQEYFGDNFVPARVTSVFKDRCLLVTDAGIETAYFNPPVPVINNKPVDIPAAGDFCAVTSRGNLKKIYSILPRKTFLARGVTFKGKAEQVIAANIDTVFIVTGLDNDFSLRRIERYLVLAAAGVVSPVIVLNKKDICDDTAARVNEVAGVVNDRVVMAVSALKGDGMEQLINELEPGKTVVFVGSSGAGKSTLINYLLGEERQKVKDVRQADSTGRHATTRREMILLPNGGIVIDTPGIREVGITGDMEAIEEVFDDILRLGKECRFKNCRHEGEPGCAVEKAVANGLLEEKRLESYRRLLKEQESAKRRQSIFEKKKYEKSTQGKYKKWLRERNRLKGK